jgi:hypothetical protein
MLTVRMAGVAILVEGESDREAVLALAVAQGVDLQTNGIRVVGMGGITNIARYITTLGRSGEQLRLTGLYDAGEERFVRRGLERSGIAPDPGREGLAALGFHCCDGDLEHELIRALGIDRVLAVLEEQGDLNSFRTMQQQPGHRGEPAADQLHRFFGAGSGRKIRYGRILVEVLDEQEIPPPLAAVLADAVGDGGVTGTSSD